MILQVILSVDKIVFLSQNRQTGVVGQVKMNNAKVSEKSYRNHCCYILQEDNLYSTFTVQETMMLSASLKISGIGLEEKKQIVSVNIFVFGIEIEIYNFSFIKGEQRIEYSTINTYQKHKMRRSVGWAKKALVHCSRTIRKSSCIILGRAHNVSLLQKLMFKTKCKMKFLIKNHLYNYSGLDSLSSANCIRLLHHLSREGRTIIFTIHQPAASIFEIFDHIYVLADGSCVYQGSANNAVPYLSSIGLQCPQYHNPADFRMFVIFYNRQSSHDNFISKFIL